MRFKNPVFELNRDELSQCIADYNSDSISRHDDAKEKLTSAFKSWFKAVDNVYQTVCAKFVSTTATVAFYRNIKPHVLSDNNGWLDKITDELIVWHYRMRGEMAFNIDDLYNEYYLYEEMLGLFTNAQNKLTDAVKYHLSDIYRYKKDYDTLNNIFDFPVWSETYKMNAIVFETLDILRVLGYAADVEECTDNKTVRIKFSAPRGAETFQQRHKDMLQSLLKGYLKCYDFRPGDMQYIILELTKKVPVKPDDDYSEELTKLFHKDND